MVLESSKAASPSFASFALRFWGLFLQIHSRASVFDSSGDPNFPDAKYSTISFFSSYLSQALAWIL